MSRTRSFYSGCGAAPQPVAEEGRRRHLTVLLIDLAGSTSMAERIDRDELRGTVVRFLRVAVCAAEQARGSVAQSRGDGLESVVLALKHARRNLDVEVRFEPGTLTPPADGDAGPKSAASRDDGTGTIHNPGSDTTSTLL